MITITSKQAYEIAYYGYTNNEDEIGALDFPEGVSSYIYHPDFREYTLVAQQISHYDYGRKYFLCVFSHKERLYGFETDSQEVENELQHSSGTINCLSVEASPQLFYSLQRPGTTL